MTQAEIRRRLQAKYAQQPVPPAPMKPAKPANRRPLVVLLVVLVIVIWGGIGAYVANQSSAINETLEYQRRMDDLLAISCMSVALDAGVIMSKADCQYAVRMLKVEAPELVQACVPTSWLDFSRGRINSLAEMEDCIRLTPRTDGSLWYWTAYR